MKKDILKQKVSDGRDRYSKSRRHRKSGGKVPSSAHQLLPSRLAIMTQSSIALSPFSQYSAPKKSHMSSKWSKALTPLRSISRKSTESSSKMNSGWTTHNGSSIRCTACQKHLVQSTPRDSVSLKPSNLLSSTIWQSPWEGE